MSVYEERMAEDVAFIRDRRAKRVAGAFRSLAQVDPETAKDEAEAFFDTPRGKAVSGYDRRLIESAVGMRSRPSGPRPQADA